ncbi:LexA family protein [Faecalitalea cylindroides]|uniref:LexA family protein n=1 Tax=Faecalitalea cylindroides TaxID=39483 RepID=UPI002676AAAA|nr:LexA family transcriptional regulator [Faecalitalea cylindroides]
MESVQDKIKKRRKELGLSLEDVAKALNVNRSTVLRYESKSIEKMPIDVIPPLAKILKCSPEYLMGWEDDKLKPINIIFDDYFPLHYCTNLSAGSPTELLEAEPDAVVYVPIKFQNRKKRLHAFQVNGTSMNNVIQDGSIVVAEEVPDTVLKEGTIVVAWLDGEATVKRLYPGDNQVMLMPDSSDKGHHPITVNLEDDQLYIIGRVIWHMNPDDIEKYY